MDTSKHTITVLAHEPGRGWITYATARSGMVAERAEAEALAEGFDATTIR
jgi:hypothetical protein